MEQTARLGFKRKVTDCEASTFHQSLGTRKLASGHAAADAQSR
jgi:hypothetical protein